MRPHEYNLCFHPTPLQLLIQLPIITALHEHTLPPTLGAWHRLEKPNLGHASHQRGLELFKRASGICSLWAAQQALRIGVANFQTIAKIIELRNELKNL